MRSGLGCGSECGCGDGGCSNPFSVDKTATSFFGPVKPSSPPISLSPCFAKWLENEKNRRVSIDRITNMIADAYMNGPGCMSRFGGSGGSDEMVAQLKKWEMVRDRRDDDQEKVDVRSRILRDTVSTSPAVYPDYSFCHNTFTERLTHDANHEECMEGWELYGSPEE